MDIASSENIVKIIICIVLVCIVLYLLKYSWNNKNANNSITQILSNKKYTMLDCLKDIADNHPTKDAMKIKNDKNEWKSITYFEYYEHVRKLSNSINYWLGDKVNVALLGTNAPGWFYMHLATMMAGGYSVGLYPSSSQSVCMNIIKESNCELLVVDGNEQLSKFVDIDLDPIKLIIYYGPVDENIVKKFNIHVMSMGNFSTKGKKHKIKAKLNQVATLIYTSGSTGKSKGAMITHNNIMSCLRQTFDIFDKSKYYINDNEKIISYLPLNHIFAQMTDIYMPIISTGTVYFADKDALKNTLVRTIKEVHPTIFFGVPRVWEKIYEKITENINKTTGNKILSKIPLMSSEIIKKKIGFDKCKYFVTAGAPLSKYTRDNLSRFDINLIDIYGMSETTGPISIYFPNLNSELITGYPIMQIKIAKDNEILVKGNNLFKGYLGYSQNHLTKDGYFKTGDTGKLDTRGLLYVTGRKKDLIITSGGEKISPAQIESNLYEQLGKYFEYIILVGDKKKFLSVLLNTPKFNLPKDIDSIIKTSIDKANQVSQTNSHTIKKWKIIDNKFKIGYELTPTLKVRRFYILEKYDKLINEMYI